MNRQPLLSRNLQVNHRASLGSYGMLRLLAALLAVMVTLAAKPASAQTYPSDCIAVGGNRLCLVSSMSPDLFTVFNLPNSCSGGTPPRFGKDGEAIALWKAQGTQTSLCGLFYEDQNYYSTPGGPYSYGCGSSGAPIIDVAGRELFNLHSYRYSGVICNSGPPPTGVTSYPNPVARQRVQICPMGYETNGVICKRPTFRTDPTRHLGGACPTCGNPISIGIGNKFQEETDYVGSGEFPLIFKRYYNSALGVTNTVEGGNSHFGTGVIGTNSGNQTIANAISGNSYLAKLPVLTGDSHYRNLGLGVIGENWRHSYQRSLTVRSISTSSVALTSAAAYRHDGRVYVFNLYNNAWVGEKDLRVRLVSISGGYQLIDEQDSVETYSSSGRLLAIANRRGVGHFLAYDACNRLSDVTHSFGSVITFNYLQTCQDAEANALIASITLPGGNTVSFDYSTGRITSVAYPGSVSRGYVYGSKLTGILDESGVQYATWTYDSFGRAKTSEHAGGVEASTVTYTCAYLCDAETHLEMYQAAVTDALNATRTYRFSTSHGVNRVTLLTQPAASGSGTVSTSYTYDANGNMATKIDFNNRQTRWVYDLARNLETSRTEAYGTSLSRTITTTWHSTFRLPSQINEPGKQTTFTYDTTGNVLTRTETDTTTSTSRIWTYTYNGFGQVLTANGPRTDVTDLTTYTYYTCTTGYQCGQVHTITNALGRTTTYTTYNAHGQPLTITDPNGVVTTLTYDLRQRLTSKTVGTEVTTFAYWPTGLIKKATMPDNSYIEYTYDAAHRLTGINDSEGNRIAYTLDNMGNRTKEDVYDPSNALTNTRTRVFNTLNRLSQDIAAAGTAPVTTTFTYDNNGNQTGINAPMSRNTVQAYDELNRLKQVTNPSSGVTQYGYNALDQLISVTDPRNKVTTYTYNALGDLLTQVSPDTGTTTNTYDSGGNLATKTDSRSITVTYAYDSLNRVTSATTADQTIQYHYDLGTNGAGRLSDVTDNSGQTAWTYDSQGRIASRQQTMGSISKTQSYGYNSAGQLSSHTLPSGNVITYGYTQGKVTSLTLNGSTTILNNVLYEPFGPTSGWTWGNSSIAARVYDLDGKVTDIDSAGLKTFGYDNAFRITGITDATNSNLSQTYGYDNLDRLTSATGTGLNQSFTYDANGNRLTQGGATSSTFTVNSANNRLNSVSGALSKTYTYDNAGNTTNDGTATFTYDQQGRMGTSTKAGLTTSYQHNALGQRVRKSNSNGTAYFVYDEAGHLIGEYDAAGTVVQEIVWLGDAPVAAIRANENGSGTGLFYIHSDHLNTPIKLTRSTDNAIVWRWDRDPFGNGVPNEDPDGNSLSVKFNLRFPGQYADAETGLYYNYFRDYDPQTGRYVESDPIGLAGGLNTFGYVEGSPTQFTDRLGLACDQRGCWNTPEELQASIRGDWRSYYGKACGAGDPYACRAGEVASQSGSGLRGLLSYVTNRKLEFSITTQQWYMCPLDERTMDVLHKMDAIRRELMQARVAQLATATRASPLRVNRSAIADFHVDVFERNGARGDAFGGSLWDKIHGRALTGYDWCSAPACK